MKLHEFEFSEELKIILDVDSSFNCTTEMLSRMRQKFANLNKSRSGAGIGFSKLEQKLYSINKIVTSNIKLFETIS